MAQYLFSVRLFNGTTIGVRLLRTVNAGVSFSTLIKQKLIYKGTEL